MNCLHNYVVNDTPAFLSQPDRLEIVFEMCKHVNNDPKYLEKSLEIVYLGHRQ